MLFCIVAKLQTNTQLSDVYVTLLQWTDCRRFRVDLSVLTWSSSKCLVRIQRQWFSEKKTADSSFVCDDWCDTFTACSTCPAYEQMQMLSSMYVTYSV